MVAAILLLSFANFSLNEVRVTGALRAIMHEDQRAGQIRLADAKITNQSIGLGVAEGLDGEITIIDGNILLDRVRNGKVERVADPSKTSAALLAVAEVKSWKSFKVKSLVAFKDLDKVLESYILMAGVSVETRVPIKITGKFSRLTAHVIDGTNIPSGESSHEIHMNSGVKLEGVTESGAIVGFFSKKDAGILTHHSTWSHMHVSLQGKVFAGHVDQVSVEAGSVIHIGLMQ